MITNNDYVILLHGLARTHRSMSKLEKSLIKEGYKTINLSYPSTQFPIESMATTVIPQALKQCIDADKIHFVTHSMGGILLRYYLKHFPIEKLGRTVMLGPPNQGSEIVDKLGGWRLFKWINGPAGQQLGTDSTSIPKQLGAVEFPVGIIAGNRHYDPLLSALMPSQHDGKVSIESTKVKGMTSHITLAVTHSFMMTNTTVIKQTAYFLKHGTFK